MSYPPQMPPTRPVPPRRSNGCLYAFLGVAGGFVALIVLVVVIAVAASGGGGEGTKKADAQGGAASPDRVVDAAGIGDPVKDGKFTFTVLSTSVRTRVGDEFVNKKAQGKFLVVRVKVKNHGDEPQALTDTAQELYGPGGKKYEADSEAAIYANEHDEVLYNDINPGNVVKGNLLFDVPKSFKAVKIVLHDSVFSEGATVLLRE